MCYQLIYQQYTTLQHHFKKKLIRKFIFSDQTKMFVFVFVASGIVFMNEFKWVLWGRIRGTTSVWCFRTFCRPCGPMYLWEFYNEIYWKLIFSIFWLDWELLLIYFLIITENYLRYVFKTQLYHYMNRYIIQSTHPIQVIYNIQSMTFSIHL